jgi:hypothetical protein
MLNVAQDNDLRNSGSKSLSKKGKHNQENTGDLESQRDSETCSTMVKSSRSMTNDGTLKKIKVSYETY